MSGLSDDELRELRNNNDAVSHITQQASNPAAVPLMASPGSTNSASVPPMASPGSTNSAAVPPIASSESTSSLGRQTNKRKTERHRSQEVQMTGSLRTSKAFVPGNEKRRNSAPINGVQRPEDRFDRKFSQSTMSETTIEEDIPTEKAVSCDNDKVHYYIGDDKQETLIVTNGSLRRPKPARRQISVVSVASQVSEVSEEKDVDSTVQVIQNETYVEDGTKMSLTFDENDVKNDDDDSERKRINKQMLRDNLSASMSGMYGIFLVVMGAVLPLTETFAGEPNPYMFEIFYIYLYTVSIIFIAYIYLYLLRWRPIKSKFLSRLWDSIWRYFKRNPVVSERDEEAREDTRLKEMEGEVESIRVYQTTARHHTGSFPLRLGAVGFGIASMIHSGLYFGQYFQIQDGSAVCHNPVHAIKPLMHLLFTFVQLYFVFMNSKISIQSRRIVARFGLMHLCCTNVCVWIRCIVIETLHAVSLIHAKQGVQYLQGNSNGQGSSASHGLSTDTPVRGRRTDLRPIAVLLPRRSGYPVNSTMFIPEISCYWTELFGRVVDEAAPYLYPCKIEYSLICAGILIVMWRNVGLNQKENRANTSQDEEETKTEKKHKEGRSINCKGSSRGLFAGILVTVGAIITMIAFYVLRSKKEMDTTAIVLVHLSKATMFILTTFAIVIAADRMKRLKFHVNSKGGIEEPLILISFSGMFMFAVFSVIAASFEIHTPSGVLSILTNLFMIVQSTIQTLFIIAGSKVSAVTADQERQKRGREFVAFLILCNFSMWAMNTFETKKPEHNPVQMDFYGPLAWSIFTHITVPLGIYFRFHSAVCLTNIWKNAWKRSPAMMSVSSKVSVDKT